MKNDIELNNSLFENLKHIDERGYEFWYARELQKALEYKEWRRFEETINRAMTTCINSKYNVYDHFANVGKMVKTGDSYREIKDYKLSRYACYLIAQNGGTMPEDLPTPKKSIKELEKEQINRFLNNKGDGNNE